MEEMEMQDALALLVERDTLVELDLLVNQVEQAALVLQVCTEDLDLMEELVPLVKLAKLELLVNQELQG